MDIPHGFRAKSLGLLLRLFPLHPPAGKQVPVELLQVQGGQLGEGNVPNGRVNVIFYNAHIRCVGAGPHLDSGIVFVPHPHPLAQGVLPGLDHVQALGFFDSSAEFLHHLRLGLSQDVPVDGLPLQRVARCVAALPPSVLPLANTALAVGSLLCHAGGLLSVFFNHQHYRIAFAYVQTNVVNGAEKNRLAFWWIYICCWAKPYSLFSGAVFEVGCADDRQRKKSHGHPETVALIFLKVLGIL